MLARLLLVLVLGMGLVLSSGCCPKQEPVETPAVEETAPEEETPSETETPPAEETPAETAPAE